MAGSCSRAPRAKTFGEPFAFGRPLKLNSDPRPLSDRSNRGVHRAHHRERRDGSGPPSSSASSTTSGYSETADARSNARRQRRREPVGGYGVTPPCAMAPMPLMRTSSTSPWDFRDDDGVADAKRMRGGNAKDGDGLIFYVHPDDVPARAIKARPYEPYKPPTPEKAREKTPVKAVGGDDEDDDEKEDDELTAVEKLTRAPSHHRSIRRVLYTGPHTTAFAL